jgi:hypothetical protein
LVGFRHAVFIFQRNFKPRKTAIIVPSVQEAGVKLVRAALLKLLAIEEIFSLTSVRVDPGFCRRE